MVHDSFASTTRVPARPSRNKRIDAEKSESRIIWKNFDVSSVGTAAFHPPRDPEAESHVALESLEEEPLVGFGIVEGAAKDPERRCEAGGEESYDRGREGWSDDICRQCEHHKHYVEICFLLLEECKDE